jgi:hypothetical protein
MRFFARVAYQPDGFFERNRFRASRQELPFGGGPPLSLCCS